MLHFLNIKKDLIVIIKTGKASGLFPIESFSLLIVLISFFHKQKRLGWPKRRKRNTYQISMVEVKKNGSHE